MYYLSLITINQFMRSWMTIRWVKNKRFRAFKCSSKKSYQMLNSKSKLFKLKKKRKRTKLKRTQVKNNHQLRNPRLRILAHWKFHKHKTKTQGSESQWTESKSLQSDWQISKERTIRLLVFPKAINLEMEAWAAQTQAGVEVLRYWRMLDLPLPTKGKLNQSPLKILLDRTLRTKNDFI